MTPTQTVWKSRLFNALKIVISTVMLVYVLWTVDLGELGKAIGGAR